MSCDRFEREGLHALAPPLGAGGAVPDEGVPDAHTETCADCRAAWALHRAMTEATARLLDAGPSASPALHEAVRRRLSHLERSTRRRTYVVGLALAAAAVLLVSFLVARLTLDAPPRPPAPLAGPPPPLPRVTPRVTIDAPLGATLTVDVKASVGDATVHQTLELAPGEHRALTLTRPDASPP